MGVTFKIWAKSGNNVVRYPLKQKSPKFNSEPPVDARFSERGLSPERAIIDDGRL